jgi:hypothetical protein
MSRGLAQTVEGIDGCCGGPGDRRDQSVASGGARHRAIVSGACCAAANGGSEYRRTSAGTRSPRTPYLHSRTAQGG